MEQHPVAAMRHAPAEALARFAQEARIPRGTLYRLLKKHALLPEDFRA